MWTVVRVWGPDIECVLRGLDSCPLQFFGGGLDYLYS